jgi:hypothetical protein
MYCCWLLDRYYPGPFAGAHQEVDKDKKGKRFGGPRGRQQQQEEETRAAVLGDPAAAGTVDGVHLHSVDDTSESERQVSTDAPMVGDFEKATEVSKQAVAADEVIINVAVMGKAAGSDLANSADVSLLGSRRLSR